MTNRETRTMLLCSLVVAIGYTAITQVQYWYAKSHHLLTGTLAVDDISRWWTEHFGWLITLFLGAIGSCIAYFLFWVICRLLSRKGSNGAV